MKTKGIKTASIVSIIFGLIATGVYGFGTFIFYITMGVGEALGGSAIWEIRMIVGLALLMTILSLLVTILSIVILVKRSRNEEKLLTSGKWLITMLVLLGVTVMTSVGLGILTASPMVWIGTCLEVLINLICFLLILINWIRYNRSGNHQLQN